METLPRLSGAHDPAKCVRILVVAPGVDERDASLSSAQDRGLGDRPPSGRPEPSTATDPTLHIESENVRHHSCLAIGMDATRLNPRADSLRLPVSSGQRALLPVALLSLACSSPGATSMPSGNGSADAGPHIAADSGSQHAADAERPPVLDSGIPRVVGSCDQLGAPMTWERITPPNTEIETKAVAVDPFTSGTLWVFNEHGLSRSTDCGSSWTAMGPVGTNVNGSYWSMALDPTRPGTIYVSGGYHSLFVWKTSDAGATWRNTITGTPFGEVAYERGFIGSVSMDPTDPLHLVAQPHGRCEVPSEACLGQTFDGGEHWEVIPATQGWEENGGAYVLDHDTIFICSPWGAVQYTKDGGASWAASVDARGCGGQTQTEPLVPAADGARYAASFHGLVRTRDDGASWEFVAPGRLVGIATASDRIFAADMWSPSFVSYSLTSPQGLEPMPSPPTTSAVEGAPFMTWDEEHRVLYASMWRQGLWRIVVP
jgi:hypothetical protein